MSQVTNVNTVDPVVAALLASDDSPEQLSEQYKKLPKAKLVELLLSLKTEVTSLNSRNTELNEIKSYMEATNKRIEALERQQNSTLQYYRRDTIEISGIPESVKQEDLEDEVLRI